MPKGVPEFRPVAGGLAPVCQAEHELALVEPVSEMPDGGDRVGVGPMKIVEHEQLRGDSTQADHCVADGLQHPLRFFVRFQPGWGR